MPWFWQRGSKTHRQRSSILDDLDPLEQPLNSRPREITLLTEPATIETLLSTADAPFDSTNHDADATDIHRNTLMALRDGCSMQFLIKHYPDDVLTVLQDLSVAPLGTMEAKDSQVLAAFGKEKMLTRGHLLPLYPSWKPDWKDVLHRRVENTSNPNINVGWEQHVTLGAYVVNLRDIAKKQKTGDFVDLLLQKYTSGAASRDVWEFPAVQAVINYHWSHWAKRLLTIVFAFFVLWTLFFGSYLFLYIQYADIAQQSASCVTSPGRSLKAAGSVPGNLKAAVRHKTRLTPAGCGGLGNSTACKLKHREDPVHPAGDERHCRLKHSFTSNRVAARWALVLYILCFAFMVPFAIEEYWTVLTLGWRWLSMGNLIDMGAIKLQIVILICHLKDYGLTELWFGYLLATQIVFLSLRLLRFVKLFGGGTTFLDMAWAVICDVRYWLASIVFTGISASFALAALYRADLKFQEHGHSEFKDIWHSLVTTFQIIFGSFDSVLIFDAQWQYPTFFIFLGFQVLMAITMLNLIIATMADSYSTLAEHQVSQYYKARAELIAELEGLRLPKCMKFDPAPYIHFLVVEKKHSKKHETEDKPIGCVKEPSVEELQEKVETLAGKVDVLMSMLSSVRDKIEAK